VPINSKDGAKSLKLQWIKCAEKVVAQYERSHRQLTIVVNVLQSVGVSRATNLLLF
jgi:hypothetical protein